MLIWEWTYIIFFTDGLKKLDATFAWAKHLSTIHDPAHLLLVSLFKKEYKRYCFVIKNVYSWVDWFIRYHPKMLCLRMVAVDSI